MGVLSWKMRSLLIGFHLVCALMGLAILGTSVYIYREIYNLKNLTPNSVANLFIAMMVLGAFTFILAFHGCCVALFEKENCCIALDAALMCILLTCHLALVVFIKQGSNCENLENNIRKAIDRKFVYYQHDNELVDFVQGNFRCCEFTQFSNFEDLPTSCCPKNGSRCSFQNAYDEECARPVANFVSRKSISGALTLFGTGVIELLLMTSTLCVFFLIKRRNTYELSQQA